MALKNDPHILKNLKKIFFFEEEGRLAGEWIGLNMELGRHADGETLDVKCVITDIQGGKVSTSVSSLCLSHLSLTLEPQDFSSVSIFLVGIILVSLFSHLYSLHWFSIVLRLHNSIRCCFESIVFSVSCCSTLRVKNLPNLLLNPRFCHRVVINNSLLSKTWSFHVQSCNWPGHAILHIKPLLVLIL